MSKRAKKTVEVSGDCTTESESSEFEDLESSEEEESSPPKQGPSVEVVDSTTEASETESETDDDDVVQGPSTLTSRKNQPGPAPTSEPTNPPGPVAAKSTPTASTSGVKEGSTAHEAQPQPGLECFCWSCHYEGAEYGCQTCPRSFHRECIQNFKLAKKTVNADVNGWKLERCSECSVANVTAFPRFKNLSQEKLALLLNGICEMGIAWLHKDSKSSNTGEKRRKALSVIENAEKAGQWEYEEMERSLVKVVSFKTIQESVIRGEIHTLEGFVGELKWLYHNSVVFNGRTGDCTELVRILLSQLFSDLNKRVWDCIECQIHKVTKPKDRLPGFFVTLCKIPHPVVWARLSGFPYWPAKVISSNSNDGSLNVFFFGDHTHVNLKLASCLTYSKSHPNDRDRKAKERVKSAMMEANEFLQAMQKNPLIGPQVVEEKAGPLPNLNAVTIKMIFPQINAALLRDMLHPTSTEFEIDE